MFRSAAKSILSSPSTTTPSKLIKSTRTIATLKAQQPSSATKKLSAFATSSPSSTSKLLASPQHDLNIAQQVRNATTSNTGAFLPDPDHVKLGLTGVTATVSFGLMLGATISKNIAAFLEENELFVPSDDDDDD